MKIDKTVWKETGFVALGTVILSAVMLVVYSAVSEFEMKMLYGAVFGSFAAVLNFFFMAYTLQKAVEIDADEKDREEKVKLKIKASYSVRSMIYVLSLALALFSGVFDAFALLIPALFPQMIARVRMLWINKHGE